MTANKAAAQTRGHIKRFVKKQMLNRPETKHDQILQRVIDFIGRMAIRAGQRKGGLGKH